MGELVWRPVPGVERAVWTLAPAGAVRLHWGDGATAAVTGGERLAHTYADVGAYVITALDASREQVAVAQVLVRAGVEPPVTLEADQSNPNIALLNFEPSPDDPELTPRYEIRWGDGSEAVRPVAVPGGREDHGYRDGTYTVTTVDQGTRRRALKTITIASPAQDPDFTFTYAGDMTVEATCAGMQAGKTARLYWDDEDAYSDFIAIGGRQVHTYTTSGTKLLQGGYTDGTGDGSGFTVEVPRPKKNTKPTSMLIIRADKVDPLAIWAMWVGNGSPSYTLHWGDGTSDRRLFWQPPIKHTYTVAGKYLVKGVSEFGVEIEQWVTVGDPDPPPVPEPEFDGGRLASWVRWPEDASAGVWRVAWPDWDPEDFTPTPGQWYSRPALPGRRPISATHLDSSHTARSTVTVNDIAWSVEFDIQVTGRTVKVRRTAPIPADPPERTWRVWWGDEWSLDPEAVDPFGSPELLPNDTWLSHTYRKPGLYFIEVGSPAQAYTARVYTRVKQVIVQ